MNAPRLVRRLARALLPAGWRRRPRRVDWGTLRRLEPVSRVFGLDRGQPIDRYYIEAFLAAHAADVGGRVLEVADDRYARQFGNGRLETVDILHVRPGHPQATLVADLTHAPGLASDRFDCLLLTQVLPFIYDMPAAVRTCHRILKPGGKVLATLAGASQVSRYDMDRWGDWWRVTDAAARRLFAEVFGSDAVTVQTYGNVLTACALLQGVAAEELTPAELDYRDPDYPVIVAVRAVKEDWS